jgi:hypothetical protein
MDAMKWPLFAGLTVALCSTFSDAQTNPNAPSANQMALVTFFSNSVDMWGSLRGHHAESFKGKLFVGQDELADMHGGRFMTVSFVPGPYEFTATTWMADGPGGGGHLKLDLTAHHHYYIELRDRDSFPMTKMFGIKQVACEEAARNNSKDKPIDSSARRIIANGSFIAEVAFPICPETD